MYPRYPLVADTIWTIRIAKISNVGPCVSYSNRTGNRQFVLNAGSWARIWSWVSASCPEISVFGRKHPNMTRRSRWFRRMHQVAYSCRRRRKRFSFWNRTRPRWCGMIYCRLKLWPASGGSWSSSGHVMQILNCSIDVALCVRKYKTNVASYTLCKGTLWYL